jgi:hypothetical protein
MENCLTNPQLVPGARIQLSELGIERCRKLKSYAGVIVSINPGGRSFRVLLDGRRQPLTLHRSYVEPEGHARLDTS